MTLDEVQKRANKIIETILGVDLPEITKDLKASDVYGWDSITHIRIIVALESEFEVLFSIPEINDIESVQKLYEMIAKKCKK